VRVSSPKVRRTGSAVTLAVFATACWAAAGAFPERSKAAPAVRPGRVVSLDELRKESAFPPLVPAAMPEGFALERIEIATVDRLEGRAVFPPRQAVRFLYRRGDDPGTISIVETSRRDGTTIVDILSANYFADWSAPGSHSLLILRSSAMEEVQYALLSEPPINSETLEQLEHVPWIAPWKAPDGNLRPLPILPDLVVGDVGTEDVGAKWPAKHVTVTEMVRRCSFRPLAPRWLPEGYALRKVELVWVVAGLQVQPKVPAQHAVRLVYTRPDRPQAINVIETRRSPKGDNWAYFVFGQGYFADFQRDRNNITSWGTVDGIDFMVVSKVALDCERVMDSKEWRPLTSAGGPARGSPARAAATRT